MGHLYHGYVWRNISFGIIDPIFPNCWPNMTKSHRRQYGFCLKIGTPIIDGLSTSTTIRRTACWGVNPILRQNHIVLVEKIKSGTVWYISSSKSSSIQDCWMWGKPLFINPPPGKGPFWLTSSLKWFKWVLELLNLVSKWVLIGDVVGYNPNY
jgi:hypothetical protein